MEWHKTCRNDSKFQKQDHKHCPCPCYCISEKKTPAKAKPPYHSYSSPKAYLQAYDSLLFHYHDHSLHFLHKQPLSLIAKPQKKKIRNLVLAFSFSFLFLYFLSNYNQKGKVETELNKKNLKWVLRVSLLIADETAAAVAD